MSEQTIEKEIQKKNLNAPRLTPALLIMQSAEACRLEQLDHLRDATKKVTE